METVKRQIEAEIQLCERIVEQQAKLELEIGDFRTPSAVPRFDGRLSGLRSALEIVESAIEREREAAAERAF